MIPIFFPLATFAAGLAAGYLFGRRRGRRSAG